MTFAISTPSPLDYFSSLVADDVHFPLLEAAASLAQDEYPDLDVQQVLGDVDQLQARLARRVTADAPPIQRLRALSQFFYRDLGYGGNVNNYYDADNSYLNVVLRTRKGIPISLAVLWLELAQGLRLEACGVGFPGHFLVKVTLPQGQVVIDPFTGQSFSREELIERLEPYQRAHGLVDDFEVPMGLFLQPCPPRDILARMLRNLKEIHRTAEDWPRLLAVSERLVRLLPTAWDELRDRGLVQAELAHFQHAERDLAGYLAQVDDAPDRDAIWSRLRDIRRSLN
ncbi:MAG: tetratricopeptide repeat protein [Burkholderiales bacterium]|nr:tetratricopeptide repeat protein [Burkholderiales bacterium]